jgi:hypothetical protein
MFNSFAKALLVLTSLAPVCLVYAWVVAAEGYYYWTAGLVVVTAILIAVCNDVLIGAKKNLERMPFSAKSVEAADRENIAFMLLYLSPIFAEAFGSLNVNIIVPTMLLFLLLSMTGYNYHFNPLLGLLRWHFYRVSSQEGVTYVLITKKQMRKATDVTIVGQLTEYILIDLEG